MLDSAGFVLGTVSVIDHVPRTLTEHQLAALKLGARQIMTLLELRKTNVSLNKLIFQGKQQEEKLRGVLARKDALLEGIQGGLLAESSEDQIILANEHFWTLFQLKDLPPETVAGKKSSELFTKSNHLFKDPQAFAERISEIKSLGTAIQSEEIALTDGRFLERDYVPISPSKGAGHGHLWIYRDVSVRKVMERTLETQRLQNSEVFRLKALGEMAGGISHEINNPMTIINGRVSHLKEMALSGTLPLEVVASYSDIILNAVKTITKIIRGLRDFARSGENDEFELVSIRSLIENTLDFCKEKMRLKSIELRVKPVPENIRAECRGVQISQILLNLLTNSFDEVQLLDEKWIEVEVINHESKIDIVVTDSGKGIPEAAQERLFEPFFTSKVGPRGTGMGLSVSRRLIETHLGSLTLDRDCKNTRFILSFPKKQSTLR